MCEITDANRKEFMFVYDLDGQLIGDYRDNASTATPTDDWLVRQETFWVEDILLWFNKAGYLVKRVKLLSSEVKDERIREAKTLFRAI